MGLISSKIALVKEKERRKRKSEEEERRRKEKKAMVVLLVFVMATLKTAGHKRSFGGNAFKNPARYICIRMYRKVLHELVSTHRCSNVV